MGGLIRLLTAATLTAHVIVGCCAHHAHACPNLFHSAVDWGTATPDENCPSACDGGAGHAEHGSPICLAGKCLAVASSSPAGNWVAQWLHAFAGPLLDDRSCPVGNDWQQRFLASGWLRPPVPPTLAHQVLLI